MQLVAHVPHELGEEAEQYATKAVVDSDGIDLTFWGDTVSLSFEGQDKVDIALAILEEDFKHEEAGARRAHLVTNDVDALESLGWQYLRASQMIREGK